MARKLESFHGLQPLHEVEAMYYKNFLGAARRDLLQSFTPDVELGVILAAPKSSYLIAQ